MTGASITATNVSPHMGKLLIYFTVTLDGSAKADFSDYTGVDFVNAVDASSLAPEATVGYTAGGDIEFTNGDNPIKGIAIVTI